MKPKQLDALENAMDTLSTCLRDARNINHELPEFMEENMDNLPKIKIFPNQDIVEVLKDVEDNGVATVARLQATYFAVHAAIKKERRAKQ